MPPSSCPDFREQLELAERTCAHHDEYNNKPATINATPRIWRQLATGGAVEAHTVRYAAVRRVGDCVIWQK